MNIEELQHFCTCFLVGEATAVNILGLIVFVVHIVNLIVKEDK